jgi:hypothetical protein
MVPSLISDTAQPWCVHATEKARIVPWSGWVSTTFSAARIAPPPTGRSSTRASGAPPPAGLEPSPAGDPAGAGAGALAGSP